MCQSLPRSRGYCAVSWHSITNISAKKIKVSEPLRDEPSLRHSWYQRSPPWGAGQQEYKRNEQNDLFLNTCFHVNPFCWITRDLFVIRDKERTRFTLLLTAALQYFRMWPCLALLWFVLNTIGSSPFGHHLIGSLRTYFDYYNNHRPHTSLDDRTPGEVYEESQRSLRSAPAAPPLRKATEQNKALQLTP